jgi:hypothetical protein
MNKRKVLIFDADKSLEAISPNQERIVEVFGLPAVGCQSLEELRSMLISITELREKTEMHPLFDGPQKTKEMELVLNEKARASGLSVLAIDTMTHMARVSFRRIAKLVMGKEMDEVPRIEISVYGQFKDLGNRVLNMIKMAAFPIIVNVHSKSREGATGDVLMPGFSSSLSDDVGQYFDVVAYAKVINVDKKAVYRWVVEKSDMYPYAKIRSREVSEMLGGQSEISQDFGALLDAYERSGKSDPKILVIAATNQGKTSALATINGYHPPLFADPVATITQTNNGKS